MAFPIRPTTGRPLTGEALEDDRSICLDCHGGGCPLCGHGGRVCPHCRGLRFVKAREWSTEHPWCGWEQQNVLRCPTCMEGNNVNPDAEGRAIGFYLSRRAARQQQEQQQEG